MMAITAGPTTTTNMAGKMNRTRGTIILTAILAACSSARCLRFVRMPSENIRNDCAIPVPKRSL